MNRFVVVLMILIVSASSCKKAEDRACWKVAGSPGERTVQLTDFDRLYLGPHLEFHLIQDSLNKVVIRGSENLLNLVECKVEDGLLRIENKNKCNFLRSYKKKKIRVEIHLKELINIEFQGTEPLTNQDTLNVNYFTFHVRDGAGPIQLNLNATAVFGNISHGFGDFTLTGRAEYANLRVSSNGYCNTLGLQISDSIDLITNTPVPCKVHLGTNQARVEINGSGNVDYTGYPSSLELNRYGTGNLVDIN